MGVFFTFLKISKNQKFFFNRIKKIDPSDLVGCRMLCWLAS
eukprot:UN26070